MKKLIFIIAVVFLASCQQKKIDRMQEVQDSLRTVAEAKDSTINNFVGSMNEIQTNLDSIKKLEEIVNLESLNNAEPKVSDKKKILNDIRLISDLLIRNKELVESQKKKLGNSGYRINEMQRMLDMMTTQLEEKDDQIAELRMALEKMDIDVTELTKDLVEAQEKAEIQSKEIKEKTEVIDIQTTELNTGYYVFGTDDELVENGIVEKTGGFLGLGRTLKFRKDFNPDLFTKVDIRNVTEISLNAKKAHVVTTHQAGSFELVGEDPVEKLVINDPDQFWRTSKYLVIEVK